jgi:ribosome maturation factor RimP
MTTVRRRAAIAACSLALAAGCGSEVVDAEYTEANRRAFLTACTESLEDTTLVRDVCECAYDEIRLVVPYAELIEIEESLEVDSLAPLPDRVVEIVADCFLAEADL